MTSSVGEPSDSGKRAWCQYTAPNTLGGPKARNYRLCQKCYSDLSIIVYAYIHGGTVEFAKTPDQPTEAEDVQGKQETQNPDS